MQACIVDEIKPRPDTADYYGNLPLYYTLQYNDVATLTKIFPKTKDYFKFRNYKYETVFHVCARYNSKDALEAMLGRIVFISQLLKKDYVGNTAFHVAAKSGSIEVLEFLCSTVTPNFLQMQNDFGFTALEAAQEKYHLVEDQLLGEKSSGNTAETKAQLREKMNRLQETCRVLINFKNWVTEESWNERFDLQMDMFLEQVADTNMRIFMGMSNDADRQMSGNRVPRTRLVRSMNDDQLI